MAVSSLWYRVRWRLLCAVLATSMVSPVIAAPRFIVSSEVHKGSVYSELTIEFRCKVHYVDHDPASKSDLLRISLDPTTICTGAPPTVALTKEQLRPVAADQAWIDTIEYFGESPGSEHLILTFTDEVRFDVRPSYFVFGGLLFVPLTRNYLKTYNDPDFRSRGRVDAAAACRDGREPRVQPPGAA